MKRMFFAFCALLSALAAGAQPYRDATLTTDERVEDLLGRMTREEKVAQLLCLLGWQYDENQDSLGIGMLWATHRADPWTGRTLADGLTPRTAARRANALQRHALEGTRLGIPLLLLEESPHGHMAIGATTFPTGLGLGATFSPTLLERMGRAIGDELKAQGAHLGLGPVLDLARDPRWSRTEETMGEDAVLCGLLGAAIVRGMEGHCVLKHLAAYGMGLGGQNGAAIDMGRREVVQTHLEPFRMALDAGAEGVMTAYNAIDGVPSTVNAWLLSDMLRGQWGFQGMVVSDLYSINVVHNTLHAASSLEEAAGMALKAGVDVDLGATAFRELRIKKEELRIEGEESSIERALDEAVRRVLRLKFRLGLFEHPYVDEAKAEQVNSKAHRALAREIARASITLLKNDTLSGPQRRTLLPLAAGAKIALVGPNADHVYAQLGDYTAPQPEGKVVTIREGLRRKGYRLVEPDEADVVVAVVGGSSSRYGAVAEYEETGAASSSSHARDFSFSDSPDSGEGLDRLSLDLPADQQQLLEKMKATGRPLVVVYIEGRPLLKNWCAEHADALLTAYYPGEQGGAAVADVLCGDYNPAGRLPVSVPRSVGQLPVFYNRPRPRPHDYVDGPSAPLYPFGYGLSYTTFAYSDLRIEGREVSFVVTNTGERDGEEVAQLYIRDEAASVVLPERQLRHFERIFLRKGEKQKVVFQLTDSDFALTDTRLHWVVEPGVFRIMVGSSSQDIRLSAEMTIDETKDLTNSKLTNPAQRGDIVADSDEEYVWPTDSLVATKLHTWQDQKFGILLHWGLYSVPGIVESWSICDENWIRRDTTMTYEQYKRWYWGLADQFRPTRFDPEQWARIAKEAGMRYMLFTTKHHDGFCLFDSRETDFNLARHAGLDAVGPVLQAFRKRGFMTGTYFSKPDWHSPFYWWDVFPTKGRNVNYPIGQYPWRWEQFKRFTYKQIEELMTRYGQVDILWLDGGWVCTENRQDIDMPGIARMARQRQPGILVVDRTIRGPYENYLTPERSVPDRLLPYPWESCIPLSDDWGWVPRPRWKSARQVVNLLIEVVAKGGNMVLGVGPTADGLIEPEAEKRLKDIGLWLQSNGKAIYGTRPLDGRQQSGLWFTTSKDGHEGYALLTLPEGEALPATVGWQGDLPRKGSTMRLLSTGQRLRWTAKDGHVNVELPSGLPSEPIVINYKRK